MIEYTVLYRTWYVSIWLHQAVRGMRDQHGTMMPNAHLVSLFNRICKLLFYKIKPVFVFDGGVPELKKQTTAARREKSGTAEKKSLKTAEKILYNLIHGQAIQSQIDKLEDDPNGKSIPSKATKSPVSARQGDNDMFHLPPMTIDLEGDQIAERNEDEYSWEERMIARGAIHDSYYNVNDVDVNASDFCSLPPELQHEILVEMKERNKHLTDTEELPQESNEFSSFQIGALLKRSKLTKHIYDLRKEMRSQSSGDVPVILGREGGEVECHQLASEASAHYILVKGHSKLNPGTSADRINIEQKEKPTEDVGLEVPVGDAPDVTCSQPGILSHDEQLDDSKYAAAGGFIADDDDDVVSRVNCAEPVMSWDRQAPPVATSVVDTSTRSQMIPSMEPSASLKTSRSPDARDIVSDAPERTTLNVTSPNASPIKYSSGKPMGPTSLDSSDQSVSYKKEPEGMKERKPDGVRETSELTTSNDNHEADSSQDDEFIEVTFNPNQMTEDELFPASVFEEAVEDASETEHPEPSGEEIGHEKPELVTLDDDSEALKSEMSKEELIDIQNVLEEEAVALKKSNVQQKKQAATVTDYMYADAQELLQLFGIPYIVAPMEAEAQCAYLDMTGQTDGSITDDSDIWLFGAKRVYRNFFKQDKDVESYRAEDLVTDLGLSRHKLVNMALLLGSDYTAGVRGVGSVLAMEILCDLPASDSFDALLKLRTLYDEMKGQEKIPQETKVKSKIRKLELNPGFPSRAVYEAYCEPTVDESMEAFLWSSPSLCDLRIFAADRLGWTKIKTDNLLLPIMKKLAETSVKIDRFFVVQPSERRKLKSKRVKRALTRARNHDSQGEQSDKSKVDGCANDSVGLSGKSSDRAGSSNETSTSKQIRELRPRGEKHATKRGFTSKADHPRIKVAVKHSKIDRSSANVAAVKLSDSGSSSD
ncbi:PREDICTED: DNA repair protein complementing XP-G cells homolog isoform X2 [Priapulus caudatus]|uniref:DNA repair protein complementing XP-G cells homolog isoform X2 n=1 Tax=Priapulus caudatus TaxID=37621 RepID=A0ABM1DXG4_PRICU|nr:PREDICTED: DNA repair protein complementing XP-G cells homolog isoform X2 [Priapulus caudatus]